MTNSTIDRDPTGEIAPVDDRLGRAPTRRPRRLGRARWASPDSTAPTYAGVLVAAVGFGLIGLAWSEIAGQSNVALQMPYLVSAGITGLALVMVGLLIVSVAAKRQDGAARARQNEMLADAVTQLRLTIEQLESERRA